MEETSGIPAADKASKPKLVVCDGYEFTVDTERLDDVDALELIDKIEGEKRMAAIVPLLDFIIGPVAYKKMKAHFVGKYGKFSITKLGEVYTEIIKNFDPKE